MKLGISTACLYPMETEKALETLLEMGFREFEVFVNTFSELEPSFAKMMRKMADEAGARIVSLHPFTCSFENMLFFTEYDRRTRDGIEFYKKYYETAAQLGASWLVLHGQRGYQNSGLSDEQYIERYARLREAGLPFGVQLAQENVNSYRGERVEFIRKMHEQLGEDCSFVLDLKQAVRAGQNPMDMARAMGDRLVHIHLNDQAPGKECLLPGCGTFDYRELFAYLRQIGYQGLGVIEVYRHNFEELSELRASEAFLTKFNQIII